VKKLLRERIESFFDIFASTLDLAEQLIKSRSHAQEILILLCARLDALASSAASEEIPRKQAFSHFLTAYGCRRNLFESISIGDIYYELGYHRWMLSGTIPKAGRIHRYSRIDDPIINLLQDSSIALTESDADKLLGGIMEVLRQAFRVMPGQPLAKPSLASMRKITETIVSGFDTPRKKEIAESLPEALKSLLYSKMVAAILYDKFRCQAIHGAKVLLNEKKFFLETEPYWEPVKSDYFGAFLLLEFPAKFLVSILRDSIATYGKHLLAKGKLPPDVLFHIADDDVFELIEFLDVDLVADSKELRFRIS
jgi:hypothetical protein